MRLAFTSFCAISQATLRRMVGRMAGPNNAVVHCVLLLLTHVTKYATCYVGDIRCCRLQCQSTRGMVYRIDKSESGRSSRLGSCHLALYALRPGG